MKTTTLMTHGIWASLAVAAFLIARGYDFAEPDANGLTDEQGERGKRSVSSRSKASSWTYGPGDSPVEFSSAMRSALSETDEERRRTRSVALMTELTPQVFDGLSEEEVPKILRLFETAGFSATWHQQESFFRAWTRLNPEAAFAYITGPNVKVGANSWGRPAVISEWAKIDMTSAQNALEALPANTMRHNLMNDLMAVLVETDLDGAIAYSAKIQKGGNPTAGLYRLVKQLHARRGVDGVQRWLDSVEPTETSPDLKSKALGMLAWRETGPDMAKLLVANGRAAFVNSKLLREIADDAARDKGDYEASNSLEWLAKLPQGIEQQGQAIGEQFEKYLKEDFDAAGKWLVDQKLGPQHDQAIRVFVREATKDDIPAAMDWAKQISDPELREQMIQFVKKRGG